MCGDDKMFCTINKRAGKTNGLVKGSINLEIRVHVEILEYDGKGFFFFNT